MQHAKITYGKYINNLSKEIPSEHIIIADFGDVSRSVEPGEPNKPTVEELSFKLANLDPQGVERYPKEFWEAQSRTAAEGAYQANQIYFRVEVAGGVQFLGMMKGVSYSKYNATCTISLSDVMEIFDDSDKSLLTSFKFQTKCVFTRTSGNDHPHTDGNNLDNAKSLDNQTINHASHMFILDYDSDSTTVLDSDIAVHLGWDNNDFGTYREFIRSAWVQVNEITLLTRVRFFQKRETNNFIAIDVWHNHEDPVVTDIDPNDFFDPELTYLYHRGQYLDSDGERLDSGNGGVDVSLVLHEPDLGNGTPSILHIDDTPLNEDWIFGVPFSQESGYIQVGSDSYSYFDVVDVITEAAQNEINEVHSDSGEAYIDLFDTSRVTTLHRKAFWADVAMTGLAENTLSEALVGMARQTSSWLYTNRFGQIVVHSRNYVDDVISGAAHSEPVLDIDWEYLDGDSLDSGFTTYEAEVPFDIIEINNLISDKTSTFISDSVGLRNQPALRNKKISLSNFRLTDLAVPLDPNPFGMPVLRYSPNDASWPHSHTLENFLPKPQEQLRVMAESFGYPEEITRIKIPVGYSNMVVDSQETSLDYLISEDNIVWWVREEIINADSLTLECEIQKEGVFIGPGSSSGSGSGSGSGGAS